LHADALERRDVLLLLVHFSEHVNRGENADGNGYHGERVLFEIEHDALV
jgi:hypothetical protein